MSERTSAPMRASMSLLALLISCLAFLPIANWIPGGHTAPWYSSVLVTWLSGSAIAIGVAIILTIFSRKSTWLWREGATARATELFAQRPWLTSLFIAAFALLAYSFIARVVLTARPLLIDEIVELFQARMLAHGHLSRPVDAYPGFFSSMHMVDTNGRYFSQFPVGGPAMLAMGVLLHASWLVGPVFGAITVLAFSVYVRITESREGIALGALLLLAFAPFTAFMAGSHMNHVTVLTWLVIGMAALAKVVTSDTPRPWLALLSGLGFGIAATIRPTDAMAFALPAGTWFLWRALRTPARWRDALPAAIGVGIPLAVLFWANARTTGSPLLFGYVQLWGRNHSLGFHPSPWGVAHTPARGLELINMYLLWLQTYFLESPVPSLIPAIVTIAFTRRLDRFDRYLLTSSALLMGVYFSYWFNGFYLGPRFMYPLLPVLAILTARFPAVVRGQWGNGQLYHAAIYSAVCSLLVAIVLLIPLRAKEYSRGLLTMRFDADSAAAASGVRNAVVFVRESWGAQLVARLWALGVTRTHTALLYGHIDICTLDEAVTRLEQQDVHGATAYDQLQPLLSDSARTITSALPPDTTERVLPGSSYSPHCIAKIREDRAGFTLFPPFLLAHGGGNIYVRDLGPRDTLLMNRYPDRPAYLLKPPTSAVGDMPQFYPMQREALR